MKNIKKFLRFIFLVVFCIMLVTSLFVKLHKIYINYNEQHSFEQIANDVNSANNEIKSRENNEFEKFENDTNNQNINEKTKYATQILPEYNQLYNENNDLYGWIKIDDTVIDYPIMYSPYDPEMYLHKDFYRQDSISGTPFVLDPNCSNIIIFSHNMKNGTMFGSLKEYKNYDFWQKHRYIQFNTLTQKSTYEIIAVSSAIAYYKKSDIPQNAYLFYEHTNLSTQQEFDSYIENAKKNAYFETGISATFGDSIITLCTCDYFTKNARLIVVAKKLQ